MKTADNFHIHIEGGSSPFTLNLKELWRYRDLILLFTKRTIALTYKQTILGPLWLVIHPLLTSIVYAAVFHGVAGLSTEGVPVLLFYLTGHSLWNLFASSLKKNARTFTDNANIFGKVYFPRLAIPVSAMLTSMFEFLVELLLIFILMLYFIGKHQLNPSFRLFWLLPVILLQTGLLGLGLGVLVSGMTTKYRDLTFVVDFGVSLWMYASPVVYPLSQVKTSGSIYSVMTSNPMTAPLELFRLILLGQGTLKPETVFSCLLFTAAALLCGTLVFNRVERDFIDTI